MRTSTELDILDVQDSGVCMNTFFSFTGILAGMRPCGIIVLLTELFTAESKVQVYGCLHNYYALHPSCARDIGNQAFTVGKMFMLKSCVCVWGEGGGSEIRLGFWEPPGRN